MTAAGFGGFHADHFVAALESVGLRKLDTIDDAAFRAAGECLHGKFVTVKYSMDSVLYNMQLTDGGAYEVLDVLRKSGFKITGPE
jgi:hypothetical protein